MFKPMLVKDLIKTLSKFNPKLPVTVIPLDSQKLMDITIAISHIDSVDLLCRYRFKSDESEE